MKKDGEKENLDKVKKDNPEQSQRFVETAERLETDKSGKGFEKAIKTISNNKIEP